MPSTGLATTAVEEATSPAIALRRKRIRKGKPRKVEAKGKRAKRAKRAKSAKAEIQGGARNATSRDTRLRRAGFSIRT